MLPVDGGSDTVEVQTPIAHMVSGHLSDTEIANAMVHAIRAIPGVLNMGQGLFEGCDLWARKTHRGYSLTASYYG